jgi:hypothetical protein
MHQEDDMSPEKRIGIGTPPDRGDGLPKDRKIEQPKGEVPIEDMDDEELEGMREEDVTNIDDSELPLVNFVEGVRRDKRVRKRRTDQLGQFPQATR